MYKLFLILTCIRIDLLTVALGLFSPPCLPVRRDFKLYYPCTGQKYRGNDDDYEEVYRTAQEAGFYDWLFLQQNKFGHDGTARWPSYGYNPNFSELRIFKPV